MLNDRGVQAFLLLLALHFSHERWEHRSITAFWIGLTVDFDESWIPPQPYGPPEEQERLDRCLLLFREPPSRSTAARREALECGGPL